MSFNKDKYKNSSKEEVNPNINIKKKDIKNISKCNNSLNSYKNTFYNKINDSIDDNIKIVFDSQNSNNNKPLNEKLNISFISNISNTKIFDYFQDKSKEKKLDDNSSFIDNSLINLLTKNEKEVTKEKDTNKLHRNNLKETDNDRQNFKILLSSKDLLLKINDTFNLKDKLFLNKKRIQNNNEDEINNQKIFEYINSNKDNKNNLYDDVYNFDINNFMTNENDYNTSKIIAKNKNSNILNIKNSKKGNAYEKIKIKDNKIIEVNENKNIPSENEEEDNYIDYQKIFENLFF